MKTFHLATSQGQCFSVRIRKEIALSVWMRFAIRTVQIQINRLRHHMNVISWYLVSHCLSIYWSSSKHEVYVIFRCNNYFEALFILGKNRQFSSLYNNIALIWNTRTILFNNFRRRINFHAFQCNADSKYFFPRNVSSIFSTAHRYAVLANDIDFLKIFLTVETENSSILNKINFHSATWNFNCLKFTVACCKSTN